MDNNFSFISKDIGYKIMKGSRHINVEIPFKPDIDPRLIRFLRELTQHKLYKTNPCVPLYMQYHIKKEDWDEIVRYIKKYKITAFNKNR